MKKIKSYTRKRIALFVVFALMAGLLPLRSGSVSRADGYDVNNPRTADGVTTWDCVWFGNYWQKDTNEDGIADKNDAKTPIKWRVLSVDGDDVFLLADQNLDCQKYNETHADVTWETCTMRNWLNAEDGFLGNAFTTEEQSVIQTTNVVNDDNSECGAEGGNNTLDRVYLLSIGEVTNPAYGFDLEPKQNAESRQAQNTSYVVYCKEINGSGMSSTLNTAWWCLRSPGYSGYYVSGVNDTGFVGLGGFNVSISEFAVRPALHLNLSSAPSWSYAGTVSSDGEVNEEPAPTIAPVITPTPEAPTSSPGELEESIVPATSSPEAPTTSPGEPEESIVPATSSPEAPTASPGESIVPATSSPEAPTASPEESIVPATSSPEAPTVSPGEPGVSIVPVTPTPEAPTVSPEEPVESMVPVTPTPEVPTASPKSPTESIVPATSTPNSLVTSTPSATVKTEETAIGTVSGLKVKIKKKKAAVTWKKVTGTKGYQICYSTSKKFKKKKQKLVKKNKITLKKLKPGKTYYVRVRAYTMSGSKKVYGKWSKVVKRKCKK